VLLPGREERGVRASEAGWDTEPLTRPDRDVGAELARRSKKR
jgi:hypothetical protein